MRQVEGGERSQCEHRMWTEPRPTTHRTQAGGGGAAAAGWEPGPGEGGEGPLENTRVWGREGNYMVRYCHQNSGPRESL